MSIDKHYIHVQNISSAIWTVIHQLEKHPAVSIVNNENVEIFGKITHIDSKILKIEFSESITGIAYCN